MMARSERPRPDSLSCLVGFFIRSGYCSGSLTVRVRVRVALGPRGIEIQANARVFMRVHCLYKCMHFLLDQ